MKWTHMIPPLVLYTENHPDYKYHYLIFVNIEERELYQFMSWCQAHAAPITAAQMENPNVQYFVKQNPSWDKVWICILLLLCRYWLLSCRCRATAWLSWALSLGEAYYDLYSELSDDTSRQHEGAEGYLCSQGRSLEEYCLSVHVGPVRKVNQLKVVVVGWDQN